MSESKTIKGQAWINGDALVQEQVLIVPGSLVGPVTNVVVLISDIWEDLLSSNGTYKYNSKKDYFFWEIQQTNIEDDTDIMIRFECPRPKEGLFEEPYNPESVEGEYAKYWVGKFKVASENYEEKIAIQKKEIVFPGTSYYDVSKEEMVTTDETRVKNNDLGDIENLLSLF